MIALHMGLEVILAIEIFAILALTIGGIKILLLGEKF